MENNIIPFKYDKHDVRTVLIDGEPWFVAKDVCDVFGDTNYRRSIQILDEDEKGVSQVNTPGGNQDMVIVNEAGLYSMLFAMRPTKARGVNETYVEEREAALKTFKRWVTHEVIPQIRKTGQYMTKPATIEEWLYEQAKLNLDLSRRMTAVEAKSVSTEQTVKNALKALCAPTQLDWQQTTGNRVKRIAAENKLSFVGLFGNLYKELENSCRVNLGNRVTRAKNRLQAAGATERDLQTVNKLYIVAHDPKLRTAFDGILRRAEARYAKGELTA
jgi:prophage antirepressor-like protein